MAKRPKTSQADPDASADQERNDLTYASNPYSALAILADAASRREYLTVEEDGHRNTSPAPETTLLDAVDDVRPLRQPTRLEVPVSINTTMGLAEGTPQRSSAAFTGRNGTSAATHEESHGLHASNPDQASPPDSVLTAILDRIEALAADQRNLAAASRNLRTEIRGQHANLLNMLHESYTLEVQRQRAEDPMGLLAPSANAGETPFSHYRPRRGRIGETSDSIAPRKRTRDVHTVPQTAYDPMISDPGRQSLIRPRLGLRPPTPHGDPSGDDTAIPSEDRDDQLAPSEHDSGEDKELAKPNDITKEVKKDPKAEEGAGTLNKTTKPKKKAPKTHTTKRGHGWDTIKGKAKTINGNEQPTGPRKTRKGTILGGPQGAPDGQPGSRSASAPAQATGTHTEPQQGNVGANTGSGRNSGRVSAPPSATARPSQSKSNKRKALEAIEEESDEDEHEVADEDEDEDADSPPPNKRMKPHKPLRNRGYDRPDDLRMRRGDRYDDDDDLGGLGGATAGTAVHLGNGTGEPGKAPIKAPPQQRGRSGQATKQRGTASSAKNEDVFDLEATVSPILTDPAVPSMPANDRSNVRRGFSTFIKDRFNGVYEDPDYFLVTKSRSERGPPEIENDPLTFIESHDENDNAIRIDWHDKAHPDVISSFETLKGSKLKQDYFGPPQSPTLLSPKRRRGSPTATEDTMSDESARKKQRLTVDAGATYLLETLASDGYDDDDDGVEDNVDEVDDEEGVDTNIEENTKTAKTLPPKKNRLWFNFPAKLTRQ